MAELTKSYGQRRVWAIRFGDTEHGGMPSTKAGHLLGDPTGPVRQLLFETRREAREHLAQRRADSWYAKQHYMKGATVVPVIVEVRNG